VADLAPEVLHALGHIVNAEQGADYSNLPTDRLLETMALIEQRQIVLGRAAAELHYRRKMPWKEIADRLGVEKSTPATWARDYREEFKTDPRETNSQETSEWNRHRTQRMCRDPRCSDGRGR